MQCSIHSSRVAASCSHLSAAVTMSCLSSPTNTCAGVSLQHSTLSPSQTSGCPPASNKQQLSLLSPNCPRCQNCGFNLNYWPQLQSQNICLGFSLILLTQTENIHSMQTRSYQRYSSQLISWLGTGN